MLLKSVVVSNEFLSRVIFFNESFPACMVLEVSWSCRVVISCSEMCRHEPSAVLLLIVAGRVWLGAMLCKFKYTWELLLSCYFYLLECVAFMCDFGL